MGVGKAGRVRWERSWENREIPMAFDPRARSLGK